MLSSSNSKLQILDSVPKFTPETPEVPFMFAEDLKHPFLLHFKGNSMEPVIQHEDWLLLDVDTQAETNDIVAVYHNGGHIVGELVLNGEQAHLMFSNPEHEPINITGSTVLGIIKSRHRYF